MLGPSSTDSADRSAIEETPETRKLRLRQRLFAWVVRALARVELLFDRSFWGLRRRFGRLGPLQLVTYRSFGTRQSAVVRGRVLEASILERSLQADTRYRSFRRMLRRFNSREVPAAGVRALLGTNAANGRTDDEGYFDLWLTGSEATLDDSNWRRVEVEVVDCPIRGFAPVRAAAEVWIPGPGIEFAIISDIDDTVLQSHVTQKLKMIWVTLSGSAFTRMPFEGTTELYDALTAVFMGASLTVPFEATSSGYGVFQDEYGQFDLVPGVNGSRTITVNTGVRGTSTMVECLDEPSTLTPYELDPEVVADLYEPAWQDDCTWLSDHSSCQVPDPARAITNVLHLELEVGPNAAARLDPGVAPR